MRLRFSSTLTPGYSFLIFFKVELLHVFDGEGLLSLIFLITEGPASLKWLAFVACLLNVIVEVKLGVTAVFTLFSLSSGRLGSRL